MSTTLSRQVTTNVAGILLVIFLARALGTEDYGRYALAILVPTLFAQLLSLGVAPANVYYLGRKKARLSTAFRATLRLWLTLSLVGTAIAAIAIAAFGAQVFPGVPKRFLAYAAAAYPLALLHVLLVSLLLGVQDFKRYNQLLFLTPAVTLFGAVVAVGFADLGVTGAIMAFALGQGVGVALGIAYLGAGGAHPTKRQSQAYSRACLGYGIKAHMSNVMMFVNYRLDLFLINLFLGPATTGVYVVAVQMAEKLWILSQVSSTVLLPRLAELYRNEDARRWLTPVVARWVGYGGLLLAGILAIVIEPVVRLAFGIDYTDASMALLLLLPGIVAFNFLRVLAADIAARNHPGLNAITAGVTLIVNLVGNLLLIPLLAMNGAALATSIAYATTATLTVIFYAQLSGNSWMAPFVPTREDWSLLKAGASLRGRG